MWNNRREAFLWDFANRYFGKIWFQWGLVLSPLTFFAMLLVYGKSVDEVGAFGGIICMILCVAMVVCIYPVERALKRREQHTDSVSQIGDVG
ncbi:MAG: SdpI family protein [Lachnospiraceae bacterium]|nr:SdpI family protein [Lachnospiraceae bacterium]